jgi:hypothetical protein
MTRKGKDELLLYSEPNESDDVVDQTRILGIIIRMQALVRWIADYATRRSCRIEREKA